MHTKRKLAKDSFIGSIYFWYCHEGSRRFHRSYREDTCGVRKVLLLAIPAAFFRYRIRKTFVRPWMFVLVAGFIWCSWRYPGATAQVLVAVVLTTLATIVALALVVIVLKLLGRIFGWIWQQKLRRVRLAMVKVLGKAQRPLQRAWEWFWAQELIPGKPLYPWLALGLTVQLVSGIVLLLRRGGELAAWTFWTITTMEALFAVLVVVILAREWAYEVELGTKASAPFRTVGRAIAPPIRGSGKILKDLWKSLKDRVCIPVEWV